MLHYLRRVDDLTTGALRWGILTVGDVGRRSGGLDGAGNRDRNDSPSRPPDGPDHLAEDVGLLGRELLVKSAGPGGGLDFHLGDGGHGGR